MINEPSNEDSTENQIATFVHLKDEISANDNLEDLKLSLGSDSFMQAISDIETKTQTTTKILEIWEDTSIAEQVKESVYETIPVITLIESNEEIVGQVITTEAELTHSTVPSEDRLKTDPEEDSNDDVLNMVGIIPTSTPPFISFGSTTDFDLLSTVTNTEATDYTEITTNTEVLDNVIKDSSEDTFAEDSTNILDVEEIPATTKYSAMVRESNSDNFYENSDSESIKDLNDKMIKTSTFANHNSKTEQSLNEGSWILNGFETNFTTNSLLQEVTVETPPIAEQSSEHEITANDEDEKEDLIFRVGLVFERMRRDVYLDKESAALAFLQKQIEKQVIIILFPLFTRICCMKSRL